MKWHATLSTGREWMRASMPEASYGVMGISPMFVLGDTLYIGAMERGVMCSARPASLSLDGFMPRARTNCGVLIGGRYDQVSYRSCLGVGVRFGCHGPGPAI